MSARRVSRLFWSTFVIHDLLLLAYLLVVRVLLALADPTESCVSCTRSVERAALAVIAVAVFGRTITFVPSVVRMVVYRVVIVGVIVKSYLMMRTLMPVLRPDSLDATLVHLDELLFGHEPALALEVLNVRPIVEWFSFFYFSYFVLCGLYVLLCLWLMKPSVRATAFGVGTTLVCCLGQLGYVAVPGFGPHQYLAAEFRGPVNGGFFWSCVWETVQAGSALKDIFPSLHTALPTWFALHAWSYTRDDPRWKWISLTSGFFATNIIVSTIVLRWHYAVDVIAGLLLAFAVAYVAPRIAVAEQAFREKRGLHGAWVFV